MGKQQLVFGEKNVEVTLAQWGSGRGGATLIKELYPKSLLELFIYKRAYIYKST